MIDEFAKLRSEMAENNIRHKVTEGHYVVSKHALDRMSERKVSLDRVINCITEGENIEVQIGNELNEIKVLFQEGNKDKPEVYAVVADRDIPVIVTVCRTKDEVWECIGNVLKRREMHK